MRVIKVQGNGQASLPADTARLSFKISVERKEYDECVHELNEQTGMLRADISACGIKQSEIKTLDFDIRLNQKYENGRYHFIGYIAHHNLALEIPFCQSTLNLVLNAITEGQCAPSISVAFSCGNKELLRKLVLEDAVRKARMNAETMAAAAGVVLGTLQSIDYSWNEVRYYSKELDLCFAGNEEQPSPPGPDIEPDDINARDTVTMVFAIETAHELSTINHFPFM